MMAGKGKTTGQVMSHDPLAEVGAEPSMAEPTGGAGPEAVMEPDAPRPPSAVAGQEAVAGVGEPVDLGESLTIPDVAQTLERFRSALDLGGTLRIAAGALEQVDAAGVQLLCAVVKDARGQALAVAWEGSSEALRQAARQLGLEQELAL